VGRFAPSGHCKRQDTLVDAFRLLIESTGRSDLELHLVGSVAADPAAREYYQAVHQRARGLPVRFHLNAPSETMERLYATSSYYWHATGAGQNVTLFPERVEHFGITVVEAMSAGAIPLVHDAGGPIEIVDDGLTGFHWHNVDDLVRAQTGAFAMAPQEAEAMRERAHIAARRYDVTAFESRWERFLGLDEGPIGVVHADVLVAS
jgi:glycosyltransferase involved in cell wall biosynthesis